MEQGRTPSLQQTKQKDITGESWKTYTVEHNNASHLFYIVEFNDLYAMQAQHSMLEAKCKKSLSNLSNEKFFGRLGEASDGKKKFYLIGHSEILQNLYPGHFSKQFPPFAEKIALKEGTIAALIPTPKTYTYIDMDDFLSPSDEERSSPTQLTKERKLSSEASDLEEKIKQKQNKTSKSYQYMENRPWKKITLDYPENGTEYYVLNITTNPTPSHAISTKKSTHQKNVSEDKKGNYVPKTYHHFEFNIKNKTFVFYPARYLNSLYPNLQKEKYDKFSSEEVTVEKIRAKAKEGKVKTVDIFIPRTLPLNQLSPASELSNSDAYDTTELSSSDEEKDNFESIRTTAKRKETPNWRGKIRREKPPITTKTRKTHNSSEEEELSDKGELSKDKDTLERKSPKKRLKKEDKQGKIQWVTAGNNIIRHSEAGYVATTEKYLGKGK